MKLTDEQLAVFTKKYLEEPAWFSQKNELFTSHGLWQDRLNAFTLGLSHQQAEVDRLREALTKELGGWKYFKEYGITRHSQTHVCLRIETITAALTHPPVKEQS